MENQKDAQQAFEYRLELYKEIADLRAKNSRLEKSVDILLAFINGKITRAEMENRIKTADDIDEAEAMFNEHQAMKEAHRQIYGGE